MPFAHLACGGFREEMSALFAAVHFPARVMSPADTGPLPRVGDGFEWQQRGDAVALRAQTELAIAVFTTRRGGVCPAPFDTLNISYAQVPDGADWQAMVTENRRICSAFIDSHPAWTRIQAVHGTDVVEATHSAGGDRAGEVNTANPAADGLWTADPTRTLAVTGADCTPILLTAPGRTAVVHAGWRGTLAGVVEHAVAAIGATEVHVGPGIGPCCLTLDPDTCDRFARRYGPGAAAASDRVDLWAATRAAARRAGATAVFTAGLCTVCHPGLFFSHRRDNGHTGRHGLLARLPG